MTTLTRVLTFLGGTAVLLAVLAYVGLRVRPAPFRPYPADAPVSSSLPLPEGMPAPVERYYRTTLGDAMPVITSAVLTGRADLRIGGIRFPARWRFSHRAGYDYRHYIEATLYGWPLMKVNEQYRNGKARLELPVGVVENDPKTDMAANLGLWGETLFMPSVFLTDPRVRWEPIDETHARLVIPFEGESDTFTATFDQETGLLRRMEAMRWKDPTSAEKTRWVLEPLAWDRFHGALLPSRFSITWEDDGKPWFVGTLEELVYNVEIQAYLERKGL